MNAFWASENLDAFIVFRSSQPTDLGRKTPVKNDPVSGDQITTPTGPSAPGAIIAVDYPNRTRLKLLGHARFDPEPDPATLEQLGIDGRLDGLVTVEVVAFDWNCPKFITPRYTADDVRAAAEPLRARIAELESVVASLGGHS